MKVQHKQWQVEPVDQLLSSKNILIVGYGDHIGAACAKVAKTSFGMKVTGLNHRHNVVLEQDTSYCDEVVGKDQYDRVMMEADFVVAILPDVQEPVDLFTMESTFSKMKESAVFINIGAGMNESDLVTALKTKMIGGAALDF